MSLFAFLELSEGTGDANFNNAHDDGVLFELTLSLLACMYCSLFGRKLRGGLQLGPFLGDPIGVHKDELYSRILMYGIEKCCQMQNIDNQNAPSFPRSVSWIIRGAGSGQNSTSTLSGKAISCTRIGLQRIAATLYLQFSTLSGASKSTMMNTFQNSSRFHERRHERKKQLEMIDQIANNGGWSDTKRFSWIEQNALESVVDTLNGHGLEKANFSSNPNSRVFCKKRGCRILTVCLTLLVILVVSLSWATSGNMPSRNAEIGAEKQEIRGARRRKIMSMILGWDITPQYQLEDESFAQGRAFQWLVYDDNEAKPEAIRVRYALATLYFSTQQSRSNITSWIFESHWLTPFPVCFWYGILCDAATNETAPIARGINLSANGLAGTLPVELGLLSLDIRSLDLSGNSISGDIPESLMELSNVFFLDMSSNHFNSTIPSSIHQLQNLVHLRMDSSHLRGSIPSELWKLSTLRRLSLENNSLEGQLPFDLTDWTTLNKLNLQQNQLSGLLPSSLWQLSSLVELRLSDNSFTGTLPSITSFSFIDTISLSRNMLTGNLKVEMMHSLRMVRHLRLDSNQLSGSIPTEILTLKNLRVFNISGNGMNGTIPLELSLLTNLESLSLSHNAFAGLIPNSMNLLSNVRELDLSNNILSGAVPMSLILLKYLETVKLHDNRLVGNVPEGLAQLSSLTFLSLHQNRLTGSMPSSFCNVYRAPIDVLTADCGFDPPKIYCGCCSECYP